MTIFIGDTAFERKRSDNCVSLLRISDDLAAVLSLIEAANRATGSLNPDNADPIQQVLWLASQFGQDLLDRIDAARGKRGKRDDL